MRITCIGIDPAGLYLGIRLKRKDPAHEVRFIAGAATPFGSGRRWCAIRSSRAGSSRMRETLAAIDQDLVRFDRVTVKAHDRQFQTRGMAFASIDPGVLLERLAGIARGLGCEFVPQAAPADPAGLRDSDLVVVADGPRSVTRDRCGTFETSLSAQQDQTRGLRPERRPRTAWLTPFARHRPAFFMPMRFRADPTAPA